MMYKLLSTLFIIGLMANVILAQPPDCNKFRNGAFYYPDIPNVSSVRQGKIQKSYDKDRLSMIWKIKWVSDCQLKMVCKKVIIEPSRIKKQDMIMATITSTDGDCYTVSVVYYNRANPKGLIIPGGKMCFIKN